MNRETLAQALYDRTTEFSLKESELLVVLLFEILKDSLGQGRNVTVTEFGTFRLKDRKGFKVNLGCVPDRRVCVFRPAKTLIQRVKK